MKNIEFQDLLGSKKRRMDIFSCGILLGSGRVLYDSGGVIVAWFLVSVWITGMTDVICRW